MSFYMNGKGSNSPVEIAPACRTGKELSVEQGNWAIVQVVGPISQL